MPSDIRLLGRARRLCAAFRSAHPDFARAPAQHSEHDRQRCRRLFEGSADSESARTTRIPPIALEHLTDHGGDEGLVPWPDEDVSSRR